MVQAHDSLETLQLFLCLSVTNSADPIQARSYTRQVIVTELAVSRCRCSNRRQHTLGRADERKTHEHRMQLRLVDAPDSGRCNGCGYELLAGRDWQRVAEGRPTAVRSAVKLSTRPTSRARRRYRHR